MKRFFRTLFFVVMMSSTPVVFTSCDGLLGLFDEILGEMGEGGDEDNDDGDYDGDYEGGNGGGVEDFPPYEEPEVHNILVEVECYEARLNIHDLCTAFANYPTDFKFEINCNECEWGRIEWEQWGDGYEWTPFLVIDSNDTGGVREMSFSINLGENNICNHTLIQYPL